MINKNKIYLVAEIGVNHNGSIKLAKSMIHAAKKYGADAVKFQAFRAKDITLVNTSKAKYQKNKSNKKETQYQMLKKYEIQYESFIDLKRYAKSLNIDFFLTASDSISLRFIVETLKSKIIKIGSGDLTNIGLLHRLGSYKKKIILSTGMSTFSDIDIALSAISHGYLKLQGEFSLKKHQKLYKKNLKYLKANVTLLHCTTEYPAPTNELNLNIIDSMKNEYGLNIGYSDHSCNLLTPIIAMGKGINLIEVHLTSNNNLSGPDHKSSLNYSNFKKYVNNIRSTEKSLGSFRKKITVSEKNNFLNVQKSLVFSKDLNIGDKITPDNLTAKRVGKGISAQHYFEFIGKSVTRNIKKDMLVNKKLILRK